MIDGARTRDISDHNRVLYQLSYDHHGVGILLYLIGYKYCLAVVLQLFDGVANITQGAVVTGLLGGRKVDLRVPAASQLLDGGDIHGAIVQVVVDLGQEARDEGAVDRDRVAGQGRFARPGGIFIEVLQNGGLGLLEGDPLWNLSDQARAGMHFADEVVHAIQRLLRGVDHQIDPFAEDIELGVSHQDRDLDQHILLEI